MRYVLLAILLVFDLPSAAADVVAVVAICPKHEKVCKEQTARSVYRIPVQGSICFVPIQQRLAELGVYDEKQDDITITCEPKPAE